MLPYFEVKRIPFLSEAKRIDAPSTISKQSGFTAVSAVAVFKLATPSAPAQTTANDKIVAILAKVNEIVEYAIANDGHTSSEMYAELENMLKSA